MYQLRKALFAEVNDIYNERSKFEVNLRFLHNQNVI